MLSTGPPELSVFFSFPPAKNAMKRPSGDQNGWRAPSVPGRGRAASESRLRTHIWVLSSTVATKASVRPSDDSAGRLGLNIPFSGGSTNDFVILGFSTG